MRDVFCMLRFMADGRRVDFESLSETGYSNVVIRPPLFASHIRLLIQPADCYPVSHDGCNLSRYAMCNGELVYFKRTKQVDPSGINPPINLLSTILHLIIHF